MTVIGGMFVLLGDALQTESWFYAGYGMSLAGGWITSGSILLHAFDVRLRALGSARPPHEARELDEFVWVFAPASPRRMTSELRLTPGEQAMVWEHAQFTRHLALGLVIFVIATLMPMVLAPVVAAAVGVALWDRYDGRLTSRYERRLFRAIVDLGFAEVCLKCGYRLDTIGEGSPHCPECAAVRTTRSLEVGDEGAVVASAD